MSRGPYHGFFYKEETWIFMENIGRKHYKKGEWAVLTEEEKKLIPYYMQYSDDEIEQTIGRVLHGQEDHATAAALTREEARRIAQEYLNNKISSFRKVICFDWGYVEKRDTFLDNVTLVIAIAELIDKISDKVPPVVLSVLLFKRGLDKLCN